MERKKLSEFGRFIKIYSIRHSIYQADIAEALGIAPSSLSVMMVGHKEIPADLYKRFVNSGLYSRADEMEELRQIVNQERKNYDFLLDENEYKKKELLGYLADYDIDDKVMEKCIELIKKEIR